MTLKLLSPALLAACCLGSLAQSASAQTSTQIFSPVFVRSSPTSAGYGPPNGSPYTFNSISLNLTCPQHAWATLSGPASKECGGRLLVDNNVLVTVTPAGGKASGPVNVCPGGTSGSLYDNNCFSSYYQQNFIIGQNPDTIAGRGGVRPLDISSLLVPGAQQTVKVDLVDEGVVLANSTIVLHTNCTENGVTGPSQVNGNPIPQDDPSSPLLNQDFDFNNNTGSLVGFGYDLHRSANDPNGSLTIPDQSTPMVSNMPVSSADFKLHYRPYTSFATSECLVHFGEVDAQGKPACKLYTLRCTTGSSSDAAGANCPASTLTNEVVTDSFDGPDFFLQSIRTPQDGTFQEGFGFLMANDVWTGGTCTFDPNAGLNQPCPQNLLVSFVGPGLTTGGGITSHPNSTFISVLGVPEARTSLHIHKSRHSEDANDDHDRDSDDDHHAWKDGSGVLWVNSTSVRVKFHSVPPYLYDLRGEMNGADMYIAQPIKSITYGISAAGSVPNPIDEPIATDVTIPNGTCPVPSPSNPGDPAMRQPAFDPAAVTLSFPGDGLYALHYFAQDCAGTQELAFTKVNGSWTTNFRTRQIGVDTAAPAISNVTLSPSGGNYARGSSLKVSFACSDGGSGVVRCGDSHFSGAANTGTVSTKLDTQRRGTHEVKLRAVDAAGNESSATVNYTVQ